MAIRSIAEQEPDTRPARAPLRVKLICQGQPSAEQLSVVGMLNESGRYHVAAADSTAGDDNAMALLILHVADPQFPIPRLPEEGGGRRVIVLSDDNSEPTIVKTLDCGAHHYFPINESPRLVVARVTAALREHGGVFEQRLDVPPFRFDLDKREVLRSGERVDLSPKEFEFAYYLFANRDRVIRNSELMTSVWSLPAAMDTRRIDTAACRIRKKMPLDERSGWLLRRLRSVGYEISLCKVRDEVSHDELA